MEILKSHCYATGIVTLLWKCIKLIVTQQELSRYYGNAIWCIGHATKENPICHNIYIYIYIYIYIHTYIHTYIFFATIYSHESQCNVHITIIIAYVLIFEFEPKVLKTDLAYMRFQVFMAARTKMICFWDIVQYSLFEAD
jgi:hypothetical protein